MSSTLLHTSNSSPLTTTNPTKHLHSFTSYQQLCFRRRDITSQTVSVSSPSIPFPQAEPPSFDNSDLLNTKFDNDGVSFKEIGESFVVKMVLENGSSASIMLPSGLITSYKPKMWHGSTVELLHTSVSERQSVDGNGGEPVILGGVSLALDCEDEDGFSWSPTSWILADVIGSSEDFIQVTLTSTDSRKMVELEYNIVLEKDTLRSEISVSNSISKCLRLTGSLISHLTVSTPDATYAFGLEGSDFHNIPPLNTNFSIISPKMAQNKTKGSSNKSRNSFSSRKSLFSAKSEEQETEEETTGEEDDNYKQLTNPMSTIYTSAPRTFTIIDRGKRNSVMVRRKGFEELYVYSPGSSYEHYGKYAYLCLGQSAILKPINLASDQVWRGELHLHNPNV